jgi:hypothetical protein
MRTRPYEEAARRTTAVNPSTRLPENLAHADGNSLQQIAGA